MSSYGPYRAALHPPPSDIEEILIDPPTKIVTPNFSSPSPVTGRVFPSLTASICPVGALARARSISPASSPRNERSEQLFNRSPSPAASPASEKTAKVRAIFAPSSPASSPAAKVRPIFAPPSPAASPAAEKTAKVRPIFAPPSPAASPAVEKMAKVRPIFAPPSPAASPAASPSASPASKRSVTPRLSEARSREGANDPQPRSGESRRNKKEEEEKDLYFPPIRIKPLPLPEMDEVDEAEYPVPAPLLKNIIAPSSSFSDSNFVPARLSREQALEKREKAEVISRAMLEYWGEDNWEISPLPEEKFPLSAGDFETRLDIYENNQISYLKQLERCSEEEEKEKIIASLQKLESWFVLQVEPPPPPQLKKSEYNEWRSREKSKLQNGYSPHSMVSLRQFFPPPDKKSPTYRELVRRLTVSKV